LNAKYTIAHSNKKDYNNRHRPRLPCPVCTFERLIDTGECTRSKTYASGDEGYLDADYYQKCSSCKAEIGIRKIE
jgi:hypothetical protein